MPKPSDAGDSTGSVKSRPSLALACVADWKPKYLIEALRFATALNLNPNFKPFADLYIGVFPDLPRKFIDAFLEGGANIVTLGARLSDHGPSNKLLVLKAEVLDAYDHVALVDCDILPVKTFPELLDFDGIQAKMADLNTVDSARLSAVFDLFGLPMPEPRWRTSIDEIATTCYCNTGCVILSRSILRSFVTRWLKFNDVLLANKDVLGGNFYFLDQASFCVCLSTFLDKFRPLPLDMNFPGHLAAEEYPAAALAVEPKLLHYHNRVDPRTGALDLTDLPQVQKIVEAFNAKSTGFREKLTETPTFWDASHESGSSGQKNPGVNALLRSVIADVAPASITDLGFGGFIPCGLDTSIAYTGIDFSGSAINIARRKYPQYRFELANIKDCRESLGADLVLMMDVLREQATKWDEMLLRRAVALGTRATLVSVRFAADDKVQAWPVFLAWLDRIAEGFRPVGRAGAELFALRTARDRTAQ